MMKVSTTVNNYKAILSSIVNIIAIFDRQLRNLLIGTLGCYGDEETIAEAKTRFKDHVFTSRKLPTDLRSSVYSTCLANDRTRDTFDKLIKVRRYIIMARHACARGLQYFVCVCIPLSASSIQGLYYKLNISACFTLISKGLQISLKRSRVTAFSLGFMPSRPFCSSVQAPYTTYYTYLYHIWSVLKIASYI